MIRASITAPASRGPTSGTASGSDRGARLPIRAQNPAGAQYDHVLRKPRNFADRMGDIEDRHLCLIAQAFQIGKDFGLARFVQGRKGFVHQQDLGRRQQRPTDRYALSFSA